MEDRSDPSIINEYIIENIRMWRTKFEWRQDDLDEAAGLKVRETHRIENRRQVATPETLVRMARAFEVPVVVLLQETEFVYRTPSRGRPRKNKK